MKKMRIYEPALCCETGICGVNVDPELLRITTVINSLKDKGVIVERYNLNSAPMEFVKNDIVNQYVNTNGAAALPVVMLDEEIVISGRYPTNEEILNFMELPANTLHLINENTEQGCCCCGESDCSSGSDCCCGESDCCSEESDCCGGNHNCCC